MILMIKQVIGVKMMFEMKIWCFLFLGALCDRKAGFASHDSRTDHCAFLGNAPAFNVQ